MAKKKKSQLRFSKKAVELIRFSGEVDKAYFEIIYRRFKYKTPRAEDVELVWTEIVRQAKEKNFTIPPASRLEEKIRLIYSLPGRRLELARSPAR